MTENNIAATQDIQQQKVNYKLLIRRLCFLTLGAAIVGFGLENFLVPNNIIDGGIVGVSIMLSYLTGLPLGVFTFCLNLPFLAFGFTVLGKKFVFLSLYSSAVLSIFVSIFHYTPNITYNPYLAFIFGGVTVGIGCGLILRNNGSLDGTEIVALIIGKKVPFSTGEIIMFMNLFIFVASAFVFNKEKAMFSILAYFVIYKSIDLVLEGIDEAKTVMIITSQPDDIAQKVLISLKRGVTFLDGKGAYSGEYKKILYCVITRLEIAKLKEIVHDIDPKAFIAITNAHEVEGGQVKKKKIV
ncbi:MAG: YitT family protein [Candidatus Gastranaerophilales bacterium]|nr:YitT family protein [Candidatus Gastranaerophilales bacterium]